MRRLFFPAIAMLCFIVSANAQDTSRLHYKIWSYYTQLSRTPMATGVLYDRTYPFSSIDFFDGKVLSDPRRLLSDLRTLSSDLRTLSNDLRTLSNDPRTLLNDPRSLL